MIHVRDAVGVPTAVQLSPAGGFDPPRSNGTMSDDQAESWKVNGKMPASQNGGSESQGVVRDGTVYSPSRQYVSAATRRHVTDS